MLEVRSHQVFLLKKVFKTIKRLLPEVDSNFSANGFSILAIGPANNPRVALLLRSELFDYYRCDVNISLEMNVNKVSKMLNCADDDDLITLRADDGRNIFTVMIESPTQDKRIDFEMLLRNCEDFGIPEIVFQATVKMPSALFARICKDLSSIGDTVSILATEEAVKFTTTGDFGPVNMVFRHNPAADNPEEATIIDTNGPVSLTFFRGYLNMFPFGKATPLSNTVTIRLSEVDKRAVVEYEIAGAGFLRFYL